jgi:hypothetical protein
MKLKDQLVSLDLAKRLKELGVKQESYFYFGDCIISQEHYSAFSVAELGEMLPEYIEIENKYPEVFNGEKYSNVYLSYDQIGHPNYYDENVKNDGINLNFGKESEADARAKMIIYLLENDFVKAEEL